MMFGKKQREKRQRALEWYHVEQRQMASRLSATEIPAGHYAVVIVDTHPWGASASDEIQIVSSFVDALDIVKRQNDTAKQKNVSMPDVQITVLDCHKQIICWVNAGPDAQPEVPNIDAVFGAKPDNALLLDEAMNQHA
jgi:hypothetical protein